jgi:glycosyltransferase involved in cell wall biosynthesis
MTHLRIAFVLPDVSGGGAARVACILCEEWVKAGHEVHLITYEEPGTAPVYPLDRRVVQHQIGLSVSPRGLFGFASNNARRIWRVRKVLRHIRPDAVIAFLAEANMAAVLGGWGLGAPVLISERNHPAYYEVSSLNGLLRRWIYPLATRLCVQTEDIRDWFWCNLHIESSVIANPVSMPSEEDLRRAAGMPASGRRRALSLGRLEPQKGYDMLVEAFALIANQVPEWDVVIRGEGGERAALERQIAQAGLERRILLPGVTASPMQELLAVDLYLHPARFEGFPNAVLEALAAGLCVVATDCPGATGEILWGGENGILVPPDEVEALALSMRRAMQDEDCRAHYADRARAAVSIYAPEAIAAKWIGVMAGEYTAHEVSRAARTVSS